MITLTIIPQLAMPQPVAMSLKLIDEILIAKMMPHILGILNILKHLL